MANGHTLRSPGAEGSQLGSGSPTAGIWKRLAINSGTTALCRTVQAAVTIAAVPFVLSKLGLVGYGVWETIEALSATATLLIGPLAGTLLWQGAVAYGSEDEVAMSRTPGIGLLVTSILLLCALPVFKVARPLGRLVHVPALLNHEFAYVMPCVVLLTVAGGFVDSFAAVVDGCQRISHSVIVRTLGQSVKYVVAIAFLFAGHGLDSLLYGFLASVVFSVLAMAMLARRLCPRTHLLPVIPTKHELKSGGRYGGLLFVGYVSAALRDQTDKLVFAFLASPIWVGYYAIASKLAKLVMEICTFVYNPAVVAAGALSSNRETNRLATLYSTLMAWIPMLSGMALVIIVGLHNQLMYLWLGRVIPQVIPLLLMLVLANALVVALTGPGTSICRGIGRVDIETAYVVFNLILNAVFTVVLVKLIGPMGTVIASVGSWTLGAAFFAWYLHRNIMLPVRSTLKAVGIICCAAGSGFLTLFATRYVAGIPSSRQGSVVVLVAAGAISIAFYLFLLSLTRLLPDNMLQLAGRLLPAGRSTTQDPFGPAAAQKVKVGSYGP
jgi:O-antigen/teichoic acid export membrane protein